MKFFNGSQHSSHELTAAQTHKLDSLVVYSLLKVIRETIRIISCATILKDDE